jgi:hypothetical protein
MGCGGRGGRCARRRPTVGEVPDHRSRRRSAGGGSPGIDLGRTRPTKARRPETRGASTRIRRPPTPILRHAGREAGTGLRLADPNDRRPSRQKGAGSATVSLGGFGTTFRRSPRTIHGRRTGPSRAWRLSVSRRHVVSRKYDERRTAGGLSADGARLTLAPNLGSAEIMRRTTSYQNRVGGQSPRVVGRASFQIVASRSTVRGLGTPPFAARRRTGRSVVNGPRCRATP